MFLDLQRRPLTHLHTRNGPGAPADLSVIAFAVLVLEGVGAHADVENCFALGVIASSIRDRLATFCLTVYKEGEMLQYRPIKRLRSAAKMLARQVPSIKALLLQRDMLLAQNAELRQKFLSFSHPGEDRQPAVPIALSRAEQLLGTLSRSARIIEIGPSFSPLAPKAAGWKTTTVDHASRADLIKKYAGHPGVDITRIEEVDCIWTNGPLADAVPGSLHGTFDAFIASHVIEHTTDFIGFLDAAETLLAPSGVVILAVPDKRYCFDYFRPLTTTGEVLEAHASRRSRHTRRTIFEHQAYVVKNDNNGAWGQHPVGRIDFFHSLDDAGCTFHSVSEDPSSPYVDSHAWQFTPASFELLLLELARLGATDWQIRHVSPAIGCEFHARLCRGGKAAAAALSQSALNARRLALLKQSLLDVREQIDWLTAGDVPPSRKAS